MGLLGSLAMVLAVTGQRMGAWGHRSAHGDAWGAWRYRSAHGECGGICQCQSLAMKKVSGVKQANREADNPPMGVMAWVSALGGAIRQEGVWGSQASSKTSSSMHLRTNELRCKQASCYTHTSSLCSRGLISTSCGMQASA